MHDLSEWQVLIIDDEPDSIGVIELVLNHYQAAVYTAVSATAALQILNDLIPTIILLDIQMPDITGFELLPRLRQDERLQLVPIIAVTAYAMPGDQERILAAGFDGYIPKPIDALSLVDDIMTILTQRK